MALTSHNVTEPASASASASWILDSNTVTVRVHPDPGQKSKKARKRSKESKMKKGLAKQLHCCTLLFPPVGADAVTIYTARNAVYFDLGCMSSPEDSLSIYQARKYMIN